MALIALCKDGSIKGLVIGIAVYLVLALLLIVFNYQAHRGDEDGRW